MPSFPGATAATPSALQAAMDAYARSVSSANLPAAAPAAAPTTSIPGTRRCTIILDRKKAFVGCAKAWNISLDGTPIGQLRNGERLSVPVGLGVHSVSVEHANVVDKFSFDLPGDDNVLCLLHFELGIGKPNKVLAEKRRLADNEVAAIKAPSADTSGKWRPPPKLSFAKASSAVFSLGTILFGFHLLLRWLAPAMMPKAEMPTVWFLCCLAAIVCVMLYWLILLFARTGEKTSSGA